MTRENADGGGALVHVAIAIAEAGDFEQVMEVVRTIKDERAPATIAQFLSERGDLKQALEVAHMSRDGRNKVDVTVYIGAWAGGGAAGWWWFRLLLGGVSVHHRIGRRRHIQAGHPHG